MQSKEVAKERQEELDRMMAQDVARLKRADEAFQEARRKQRDEVPPHHPSDALPTHTPTREFV